MQLKWNLFWYKKFQNCMYKGILKNFMDIMKNAQISIFYTKIHFFWFCFPLEPSHFNIGSRCPECCFNYCTKQQPLYWRDLINFIWLRGESQLCLQFRLLLMCTLESSRWWLRFESLSPMWKTWVAFFAPNFGLAQSQLILASGEWTRRLGDLSLPLFVCLSAS